MDIQSLISNILFLSSIKKGSFDYSFPLKSDIEKFYIENNESSPLLFDYIIYTFVNNKLKNGLQINNNLIVISEDYLKSIETFIINDNEKFFNEKIFLIPFLDKSNNKWGLIILSNLFSPNENEEINTKIICDNKNNNINNYELIINNFITKININLKNKKINYKNDIIDIGNATNTSKCILKFIKTLFEYEQNNINEYINECFNNKNIENESINDEIFKNLDKYYDEEYNAYMKMLKEKNNNCEISQTNNINDSNVEIETNNKIIEKQENNNYNIEDQEKKNLENKNGEKITDNENGEDDELDELAKKIVKNIMNLKIDKSKEPKNKNEILQVNNSENKELNIIDEDDKEENIENKSADDIFDLNFEQSNMYNCENKKIDEVTKNTIDDILDSVLKDMKVSTRHKYKKKTIRNNKKESKYRLKTINIDQKIDIIEEEDKESSTSEIPKEIKTDNINKKKDDEELRFSIKNNNSFEIERRPSLFSYNQEKNDDIKIKEGEIDFEDTNIFEDKKVEKKIELKDNNLEINNDKNDKNDNLEINNDNNDNNDKNDKNDNNDSNDNNDKNDNNDNNDNNVNSDNNDNNDKNDNNDNNVNNDNKDNNDNINANNDNIIDNNDNINDNLNINQYKLKNNIIKENNFVINNNNFKNKENNKNNDNYYKNNNDIVINDNNSNNDNITISNNNSVIDNTFPETNFNETDSLNKNINDFDKNENYEINNENNKNLRKSSPKDNIRNKQNKKLPHFIFNNVINNNNTNNININTINAKNIVIINNTIYHHYNNNNNKKEKIRIKKEKPEDEIVPKDNKRRRNKEKGPCDTDPEKVKLLIKQTFRNHESKYNSKTINFDKQIYRDKKYYNDISRSLSDIESFRKIISGNYYDNDNIKHHSDKKVKNVNNDFNLGQKSKVYGQKTFYLNNPLKNTNNKFVNNNQINKYSTLTTYTEKRKIKNAEINNLENKYPLYKNNNNINFNYVAKSKTLDCTKSKRLRQKVQFPKLPFQYKNIKIQNFNENKNVNDDNCILI